MGINRGSLYDTFGNKRSLFLAAIAHYDDTVVKDAIARLEALAEELRLLYERFGIDLPTDNGDDSFELPIPATYVKCRKNAPAITSLAKHQWFGGG